MLLSTPKLSTQFQDKFRSNSALNYANSHSSGHGKTSSLSVYHMNKTQTKAHKQGSHKNLYTKDRRIAQDFELKPYIKIQFLK